MCQWSFCIETLIGGCRLVCAADYKHPTDIRTNQWPGGQAASWQRPTIQAKNQLSKTLESFLFFKRFSNLKVPEYRLRKHKQSQKTAASSRIKFDMMKPSGRRCRFKNDQFPQVSKQISVAHAGGRVHTVGKTVRKSPVRRLKKTKNKECHASFMSDQ